MKSLLDCPAPAKLNLFLHVIGRREDGYHLLQSAFQLIDLADTLHFERREDARIVRTSELAGIRPDDDLVVRAATALQAASGSRLGVNISLEKRIPLGGGLGGGSSDAATTLIALNRLWECGLSRAALMQIGLTLGADVPFFVFGQNAFAQGVGELLTATGHSSDYYAVIHPGVAVPTALIFSASELTRDTKPVKISDFCASVRPGELPVPMRNFGHNDLEAAAVARFGEVGAALAWLGRSGHARMTGSGACVFGAFESRQAAQQSLLGMPGRWRGWVARGLDQHPLAGWTRD